MSPKKPPGVSDPAVRNYLLVCLGGLLVALLGLWARGHEVWVLFPVVFGMATLLLRWRAGAIFFLVVLAMVLEPRPFLGCVGWVLDEEFLGDPPRGMRLFLVPELVIAAGVLLYVAAYYRMVGLVSGVFPLETSWEGSPRRRLRGPPALTTRPRSSALATTGEVALLLAALPLWVGLALVAYPLVVPGTLIRDRIEWPNLLGLQYLFEAGVRCRFVVLGTGVVVLMLWGVSRYLSWRRWSPAQAKLALQDVVWSQTRGEDRRINTWRMWALWRRKGKP
jgi:hypothetical protein